MRKLCREEKQVCWICPLDVERTAAEAMLDERHEDLPNNPLDTNVYTLGRIGKHNVAIAGLPVGNSVSTANAANQMKYAFRAMRVVLLVGIGGGAPSKSGDIRLGDIAVSYPDREYGGVVQVDSGKIVPISVEEDGFQLKGTLKQPPDILLNVVKALQAKHLGLPGPEEPDFMAFLRKSIEERPRLKAEYPGANQDRLFEPSYDHPVGERSFVNCDDKRVVPRKARRSTEPQIHTGLIASANNVRRDGRTREKVRQKLNILCFEMEAAGIMNDFPCLVIRGRSDYADSHKNDQWQAYAALAAAAYAKEWLLMFPEVQLSRLETVAEIVDGRTTNADNSDSKEYIDTTGRSSKLNGSKTSKILDDDFFKALRTEDRCFRCGLQSHWIGRCIAGPRLVEQFRRENDLCFGCGKIGHCQRDCSNIGNEVQFAMQIRDRCYNCGGVGH
jgi:nucleoside phosphorylase